MNSYENRICGYLIDKYERSKTFTGDNKVEQTFAVTLRKLIPKYGDPSEYDIFIEVNEAVSKLVEKGYITARKGNNGIYTTLTLNVSKIDQIYAYLDRTPKAEINVQLLSLIDRYDVPGALHMFCEEQRKNIKNNKNVECFDGDIEKYEMILKAIKEIYEVKDETYIRDFSIRVFGDSKAFEGISSKVKSILYRYGDLPDEDTVLEDMNIVKNPGHVYIKGDCIITIGGQTLDLSRLKGDIAISSELLDAIEKIELTSSRVYTIENLTSFHSFKGPGTMIYLGGYHNSHRRNFIRCIYNDNPDAEYFHYGDIDAGGFYILLHLRKKTGIDFKPYHMDIDTLRKYQKYTKRLSDNDIRRLKHLIGNGFDETINYMLEHYRKLEQEALDESDI